jgi:hypothetical protein
MSTHVLTTFKDRKEENVGPYEGVILTHSQHFFFNMRRLWLCEQLLHFEESGTL